MKDQEIIKSAMTAYKNKARLEIDNSNRLVIRNLCPPHSLHKFIDGRDFIQLGKSEIVKVRELIR